MRPSFFYGTAISTAMGLVLGMSLHSPWASRDGGPQTLVASAAATELARKPNADDLIEAAFPSEQPAEFASTDLDMTQLPPDSLPVVRLTRSGGQPIPAAESIERVTVEEAEQITTSDGAVEDKVADAAQPPAQRPIIAAAYTPGPSGF